MLLGQFVRIAASNGQKSRGGEFSFTEPYFLGYRLAAGFDLFKSSTSSNTYYDYEEQGGTVRVTAPITEDLATTLRGYDRSPEATASPHLWRGALPTDLPVGSHKVEVRSTQPDGAVFTASTSYSLQTAQP